MLQRLWQTQKSLFLKARAFVAAGILGGLLLTIPSEPLVYVGTAAADDTAASVGDAETDGSDTAGNPTRLPPVIPSSPLYGVWDVETRDNPEIEALTIFVHHPDGTLRMRDPNHRSPAHGVWWLKSAPSFWEGAFAVGLAVADDGTVSTSFGGFGYCNCRKFHWSVVPTSNRNVMVGTWKFEGEEGISIWRRRPWERVIRSVNISQGSRDAQGEWVPDQFDYGTRPGRIEWKHNTGCAGARANCRSMSITVLGDNFAGEHDIWIDPVKFESNGFRWVCSDGSATTSWAYCGIGADPGSRVIGLVARYYVLHGVEPGAVNLWIDGLPIPIDIVIDDYPQEDLPQKPELAGLDAVNASGKQITEIREGKPFQLSAIYDGPHPDAWVTLDVLNELGVRFPDPESRRSVVLVRTQDPKVFQSDWLFVVEGDEMQ